MQIGLKHLALSFFLLFFSFQSSSQNSRPQHIIDSLLRVLNTYDNSSGDELTLADTSSIIILNQLAELHFRAGDNNKMFFYISRANELCAKLLGKPQYSNNRAVKRELGRVYQRYSNYYMNLGVLPKAFENYFLAVKIREEIADYDGLAESFNIGGNLYKEQDNLEKSLELYARVLDLRNSISKKEPGNKSNLKGIAGAYNNTGLIYKKQKKYHDALGQLFNALKIKEAIGEKLSAANSLGNIGTTYSDMKNHSLSHQYSLKALAIYKQNHDLRGVASIYFNMAENYVAEAEGGVKTHLKEAHDYLKLALEAAKENDDISLLKDCYHVLTTLRELENNHKEAMHSYKLYIQFRDSLNNSESTQKIIRAEMNNEFEKKILLAKQKQEVKDALRQEENTKQKNLINLFISAFVFMLVLAIFIFISFRGKQKANEVISRQKREMEMQKSLAEKKQKQIIDSINYAKRIQSSILPHSSQLQSSIPQSFIIYLPKDIVSGDFYWFHSLPDTSKILIAVADCTGHGVPGAFLSMVGSTLLNDIVIHKKIIDPAQIIKELSYGVSLTLINKEEDHIDQDGMDVTICVIDLEKRILTYAAANQYLYIVNNKETIKIDPQVNSMDGIFDLNESVMLTSKEIILEAGASIYLSTDGYSDQIDEKNSEKFNSERFESLLKEIHLLDAEDQKQKMEETLAEWKGNAKQIDDILVIGFKI